ncbi:hypothetical protein AVEN_110023-1 [Araneus ventricosus]|uniref:Uncharacterized protein n=1 Tax=Araneus ventricosus TaxID=182803 RepID=A0A4Y2H3S3_ARAVE|nr:hypothetical protein AVEN_110023-1 [Araneus ventricosus]
MLKQEALRGIRYFLDNNEKNARKGTERTLASNKSVAGVMAIGMTLAKLVQYDWCAQLTSFLARTADRTPKTFVLQGDPSRSTSPPSSKHSPYIVSRGRP